MSKNKWIKIIQLIIIALVGLMNPYFAQTLFTDKGTKLKVDNAQIEVDNAQIEIDITQARIYWARMLNTYYVGKFDEEEWEEEWEDEDHIII